MKRIPLILIFLPLLLPLPAFADSLRTKDLLLSDISIRSLTKDGLLIEHAGQQSTIPLSSIDLLQITNADKFNAAESARAATDNLKAAALYPEAIHQLNDENLKHLAELRAIAPLDADGKFTQALDLFLTVYASLPEDNIWALRPTHLPDPASSMLTESAKNIESKLAFFPDPAKHNLKLLALDLYTRANDPREAIAAELNPTAPPPTETPASPPSAAPPNTATLEQIQLAIKSKDFTTALQKADTLLQSATGDAAIQLFILKALAYEGQSQPQLAAAELLRIPIHYPASTTAPDALYQAALLQKRTNHPIEAQHLLQEILTNYPDSPAAAKARNH